MILVDEMPRLSGSNDIKAFLMHNLRVIDTIGCIVSKIIFEFIFEPNGVLSSEIILISNNKVHCYNYQNIMLIKQLYTDSGYDISYAFPRFISGKLNGVSVPVRFTIPIQIDNQ